MKPDLKDAAMKIFNFTLENCINLGVEWIQKEENASADYMDERDEVEIRDIY